MPFIPKKNPKIGQWVYLKMPIETPEGTFTTGTRVLLQNPTGECFDFHDEPGNRAYLVHKNNFTTTVPS